MSKTILIVEDEKIIALDLKRRLEKFGYLIPALVSTAQAAVEKAGELRPDIILMDIMLAGESDGIDAAMVIKSKYQIPVIFLTAYADEKTLERAKIAEPFGYILKPFKERELYTTIDIALYKDTIERKLKKQERLFSAILHSVGDSIIATDTENRIQFMNPVAEELTGWKEEEAKDLPLNEILNLIDEKSRQPIVFSAIIPQVQQTAPWFFDNVLLTNKRGITIDVEGTVAQIHDKKSGIDGQVYAFRDVSQIKRMSDTISYQASHDSLTGLVNRSEFSIKMGNLLANSKSTHNSHALIYLDLDQFKIINDTCGHLAGDELLRQVSDIVKNTFRSTDTCARLGGDEFAVLLEKSSLELALSKANLVKDQLSLFRFTWQDMVFAISASIGVVPITHESKDIHSILAAADDACYLAKGEGGNKIKVYETSDNMFLKRRGEMNWISHLTRALEEDRFRLYYQVIEPLQPMNGERKKCELLIRLMDQDGNMVPPADFIPAAERYNFMPTIDKWVIRSALQQYKKQLANDCPNNKLFSINLSGSSIADETLLDYILEQFRIIAVPPEAFCFEITETSAIENMAKANHFIKELKRIGCTFALDDFGRGFSSFEYLKTLPVDYLKIDGSFVQDLMHNPVSSAMVTAINNIGHVMGLKTIAEFVKDSDIKVRLQEIGVDYAQGYEIAIPLPFSEMLNDNFGRN